jgi:superfamily II DNA/RNA helicase
MNVKCHTCVGGTIVREDMSKLQEGVHVVVGTPSRIYNMISCRTHHTDNIKQFVSMKLMRCFCVASRTIYKVFQLLPQDMQVVFLSATMPADRCSAHWHVLVILRSQGEGSMTMTRQLRTPWYVLTCPHCSSDWW